MRNGLFWESGDRGEGACCAHNINNPDFYYFVYGGVGRAMGCMDGDGAKLDSFLFAMLYCKIATMRKRMAFREGYDICFSGIEA